MLSYRERLEKKVYVSQYLYDTIIIYTQSLPGIHVGPCTPSVFLKSYPRSFIATGIIAPTTHHIDQLRPRHQIRLHLGPDHGPLLKRIRQPNQQLLTEFLAQKTQAKRQVRTDGIQAPASRHEHRVRRVEAQRDGDDGVAEQGGHEGREGGREDDGVEGVVPQGAGEAERAGEVEHRLVGGPEARVGVAEAGDVEGFVPRGGVAVRVVLDGGPLGEVADVLEVLDPLRVGGELGEVVLREVGEEVGVEDDARRGAVQSFVAGEVGVVDDGGAGVLHGLDRCLEGVEDGSDFVGVDKHVAGNPETLSPECISFARLHVIWGLVEWDG